MAKCLPSGGGAWLTLNATSGETQFLRAVVVVVVVVVDVVVAVVGSGSGGAGVAVIIVDDCCCSCCCFRCCCSCGFVHIKPTFVVSAVCFL